VCTEESWLCQVDLRKRAVPIAREKSGGGKKDSMASARNHFKDASSRSRLECEQVKINGTTLRDE